MELGKIFIDTNVLVYAHDTSQKTKYDRASKLVQEAWEGTSKPWISAQVIKEFASVMLSKKKQPLAQVLDIVENYSFWQLAIEDRKTINKAHLLCKKYKISIWDAHILSAAISVGAKELWTEDLNHEQDYGGVKAYNPFL